MSQHSAQCLSRRRRPTLRLPFVNPPLDPTAPVRDETLMQRLNDFGDFCASLTEEDFEGVYVCPSCIQFVLYETAPVIVQNLVCPRCDVAMRSGKDAFEQALAEAIPKEPGC